MIFFWKNLKNLKNLKLLLNKGKRYQFSAVKMLKYKGRSF